MTGIGAVMETTNSLGRGAEPERHKLIPGSFEMLEGCVDLLL